MITKDIKCVLVIDADLPTGVIANTSAILGITIGGLVPEIIGHDVNDGSGQVHKGIVTRPIPVLKGDKSELKTIRRKLYTPDFEDVTAVDFSDIAQACNTYEEYAASAGSSPEDNFNYLGLFLYGDKKKVNRLTGSMPLLR